MTDQTADAIRSAPVEAYLDSVDEVLLAARVPRSERAQVIEDLTSQIADMLGTQPTPITADAIHAVLAQLEPPARFAAQYGASPDSTLNASARPPVIRIHRAAIAAFIGAACVATASLAFLFALMAQAQWGFGVVFLLMAIMFVGTFLTPIALLRTFRQLKAHPGKYRGRNLAAAALLTYAACMPIMLLILTGLITAGLIFYPLGFLAFAYAQYKLIQHLRHHTIAALPADPPTPPTTNPLWSTAPGNHAAAV